MRHTDVFAVLRHTRIVLERGGTQAGTGGQSKPAPTEGKLFDSLKWSRDKGLIWALVNKQGLERRFWLIRRKRKRRHVGLSVLLMS